MIVPISLLDEALHAAGSYLDEARGSVAARVQAAGRTDPAALERDQFAAHGFAWIATYVAGLREMLGWAQRLDAADSLTDLDRLVLQAAFGEYLAQLSGGIVLSQGEVVRPADLGLDGATLRVPAVARVSAEGNSNAVRMEIAALLAEGQRPSDGLEDESLALVRGQFRRFADERIVGPAHGWHSRDELIPMPVVEEMAEMGVFGLTVPEEWGGLGMGKVAMCVVTEELSRGYIGVGSLGTRSEIAAELIRMGGAPEQKERWLPGIASGAVLPTAVFTEPDVGSDLGGVKTRAVRNGGAYRISGAKTWITHAARADLMTLLARTDPDTPGYRGLSMFLAPKTRGDDGDPFPDPGIDGGEIPVLGYRGMKEYEIGFDGFEVDAGDLLGREEGQGFKQLMATFESARIQTAARSVGVAERAMELALDYAAGRRQFGKAILGFPRVAGKIAWMAVETQIARQLAYFAAREKDGGRRCDIEAGMAKLLAARAAWANADNAVQVHGGNGYSQEYEVGRILCDARILNIFEGAAEIQAHVIARGLLERRN